MASTKYVTKRDGKQVCMMPEKIFARIKRLSYDLPSTLKLQKIVDATIPKITEGMKTREIDHLTSETCADMVNENEKDCAHYTTLAARILVSDMHKETHKCLKKTMAELKVSEQTMKMVNDFASDLNSHIVHANDYRYSLPELKQLQAKLSRNENGKLLERPSHHVMRNAIEQLLEENDHQDITQANVIINRFKKLEQNVV